MASNDDSQGPPEIPSELPFELLLAEAPFGVLVIDSTSTIRYTNEALTDTLGYEPAALVGESLTRLIPSRLQSSHLEAFEAYLESGQRHLDWDQIELSAVHSAGHEVPVVIAIQETPTEDKDLFTGIVVDVSEQSRLERELEANVDVLHELYVIASDSTLSFEQRRQSVLELGCRYLDLPYGFVTEITSAEQTIVDAVGDHELLQSGETCPIEESYCRRTIEGDGFLAVANAVEEGWEEDRAYERFGLGSYIGGKLVVDGGLFGTLCFASHDPRGRPFSDSERTFVELASRWLGYEIQQRRQRRQLERQNDRLDRFASRASHDLRNPLSAAKGRLELARERHEGDEDIEAALEAIADADARIDETLEFARLGGAVTDPQPVALAEAARVAWERAGEATATMTVEDDIEIRGDRDRIERLLENLFRNSVEHGSTSSRTQSDDSVEHGSTSNRPQADDSVEHGSTGSPTESDDAVEHAGTGVTVRLGGLSDGTGFYVADDGPGVPEDDRETVLGSGYTTSEEGSGFGLAIVTEIAAAHGWDVRVIESAAGGARFEIVDVTVS
ncbi:PAS domain S-box protein [Natronomonas sp. F2-12]|uniref:histidine kinase n=1 Tax=Natronomonas aquatica TaxID=2841590 RepID=A0A9R1CUY1_9EURY|nr:ATP-binding protein [Natronomonas aquatica]MCQ4334530.1 PAS domain S-box protein [Natronomonas aquatica]